MKQRVLSLIMSALVFVVLFTACSGNKSTGTDTTSEKETSDVSQTQEGEKEATDGSQSDSVAKHNVFGEFESVNSDGEKIDHTVFEGKITMVNVWATISEHSINQMSDLERINEEYADRNFQVVGIVCGVYMYDDGSLDSYSVKKVQSIIDTAGVSYLNILPSASLNSAKLDESQNIPETIFLDENGNQIGESYIGSKSYEEWCSVIDSVLA